MSRWEEYKAGETEPLRVEGTAIGKAAVAEFVRGLTIRESSPMEPPDLLSPENREATASFHFFKWLAEVPGWKTDSEAMIITAWMGKRDGKMSFVTNMLPTDGKDKYTILGAGDLIAGLARRYTEMAERYEKEYGLKKEEKAV